MYVKELRQNLIRYMRCQWPYALTLVLASVLGFFFVRFDNNPNELWAWFFAITLFAISGLAYVTRIFISAFKLVCERFSSNRISNEQSLQKLLWSHILAFIIIIYISCALFFACVSIFAWQSIANIFMSFIENWIYIFEFLLYVTVVPLTTYILPTLNIVAFRFNGKRKLSLALSVISLFLCVLSGIIEVMLLIHSSSTDMTKVWTTIIVLVVFFVLADTAGYKMTYSTLKKERQRNQTESQTE